MLLFKKNNLILWSYCRRKVQKKAEKKDIPNTRKPPWPARVAVSGQGGQRSQRLGRDRHTFLFVLARERNTDLRPVSEHPH